MDLINVDVEAIPDIEPDVYEHIEKEYYKLLKRMNQEQETPQKEPMRARDIKADIEKAKQRFEELKKARI